MLQNIIVTQALLISPWPLLYISSLGLETQANFELHKLNPRAKKIASKMLDFPVPFSPVRALN